MKAYVIKTTKGYFGWRWDDKRPLNGAVLFPSKAKAEDNAVDGETVIEVEILKRGRNENCQIYPAHD
jgi:hypothetical protein